MPAAYPPVGTRVRWTSAGRTREGVVVMLHRDHHKGAHRPYLYSELAFAFLEVFGWPPRPWLDDGHRDPRYKEATEVVDVDLVDGQPRTGKRRYYHPRVQWLEVVETGEGG